MPVGEPPPALALHPCTPAIALAPALGVPAPRAVAGRVVLLGIDLLAAYGAANAAALRTYGLAGAYVAGWGLINPDPGVG